MRKAEKRQTEDLVKLLEQAHEEIRRALEKKNTAAAMSLLADCQNGALALGTHIEKLEGEGTATIPLLEEYCELVYQIYQVLENRKAAAENATGEKKTGETFVQGREAEKGSAYGLAGEEFLRPDKVYKRLRRIHSKIAGSVQKDIKVRQEVVFLPYKASMWDSLESVWKASDKDPDCDAYVIPIPYYDRQQDGRLGEVHYELDQYPMDVPVMRYEEYDFEKRQPDVIFIHNPYDDCNHVTSVHPFFYSRNLKRFTEKLVYIPYFILGEIDPENLQAVKGIEHFCLLPGVWNADRVIVQSENMKKIYIQVLTKTMKEQGFGKKYWEERILGLGSPKIDKVLNTRKEELKIPEEWRKVIEKADGSWKKIVFYNTSVGMLLKNSDQYLLKLRDVLKIFYENRDEVVLLWRPHPLMKATIESMRPQLWDEYWEIVKQYRAEEWGIYDDTADMDRAVVISDGYYGDASSITHLCREVGVPLMIQNVDIRHENF